MRVIMKNPQGLLKLARKKGVKYIIVTDHNRALDILGSEEFLISGEEWGQKKGHSNFIGIDESVDPECGYFKGIEPVKPRDFKSAVTVAKGQGAFVSINHPFKKDRWTWGEESYELADAIEIWNGKWCEENQKALDLWQNLLSRGFKIWCLAGSDFHVNHLFSIDSQVLAFIDTDSRQSLLAKLKNGNFSIARDTKCPVIFLSDKTTYRIENFRESLTMKVISGDHNEIINNPAKHGTLKNKEQQIFVRVELWEGEEPLSFSNPIFF
jgi:predicted metal-dependent phosphoesterase TrpH